MMLAARVELICPRCHSAVPCSVGWVQEHGALICPSCGEITAIDKDAVTLQLARIEIGREQEQLLG